MARVEVRTKDPDIEIIVDTGTNKDIVQMVKEIYKFIALKKESKTELKSSDIVTTQNLCEDVSYKQQPVPEVMPGERRLPNNIVDPNTLSIKQAVKENALVRCPHCGQSHVLAVKSSGNIYVMRMNYQKKNYEMITSFSDDGTEKTAEALKNICYEKERYVKMHGEEGPRFYLEDIQNVEPNTYDKDFVAENQTEIFCPVCGKSDTFEEWKRCYEYPLQYFNTDQLCDACGGEMTLVQKRDAELFYKCDKCGWEKREKND